VLNKIVELSAELGKAQLILTSKDEQIEKMQEFIDKQTEQNQAQDRQMREQSQELTRLNAMIDKYAESQQG